MDRQAVETKSGQTGLTPREYVSWIEDVQNGIKVEKKFEELNFSVCYNPYEFICCRDLKKESITQEELKSKVEEINDLQYFIFRISAADKNCELLRVNSPTGSEYERRVDYFSFKMQKDLQLIDGSDTLSPVLFHFERVYGMAPYSTFLVGFPVSKEEKEARIHNRPFNFSDKTFVYDDHEYGVGIVNLSIQSKNINRIPKLKTT